MIWNRLRQRIDQLFALIADAQAAGLPLGVAWLYEQQRLGTLQVQIIGELDRFARLADVSITADQRAAIAAGRGDTRGSIAEQLPGVQVHYGRLHTGAVEAMVGHLSDGSPLSALLSALGPQLSQAVSGLLVTAIATGIGPRALARQIASAGAMPLHRALTISRTETNRAYRAAAFATARDSGVISGWIWRAGFSTNTCAACWYQEGSFHDMSETLDDHVNGACVPEFISKSFADLSDEYGLDLGDIPEWRPDRTTGEERFANLSEARQRQILGPGKYAAYAAGEITLADLVKTVTNSRWGPMIVESSLAEARQNARRRTRS